MPEATLGVIAWVGGGLLAVGTLIYQFLRLHHDRKELRRKVEEAERAAAEKDRPKIQLPTPEEVARYGRLRPAPDDLRPASAASAVPPRYS